MSELSIRFTGKKGASYPLLWSFAIALLSLPACAERLPISGNYLQKTHHYTYSLTSGTLNRENYTALDTTSAGGKFSAYTYGCHQKRNYRGDECRVAVDK